jgi:hypothetical protein
MNSVSAQLSLKYQLHISMSPPLLVVVLPIATHFLKHLAKPWAGYSLPHPCGTMHTAALGNPNSFYPLPCSPTPSYPTSYTENPGGFFKTRVNQTEVGRREQLV